MVVLAPSALQAACRSDAPAADIGTYVLLVGWPDPPSGGQQLQVLKAVTSDVLAMYAFFGALRPWCMFVHTTGVTDAQWGAVADEVKLPKWASILRSVARVTEETRKHPDRPSLVQGGIGSKGPKEGRLRMGGRVC